MANVRTFVAIELDPETQRALSSLLARLKHAPLARVGRWMPAESIHLTIKFLGDVPEDRLSELQEALARACAEVGVFEICIAGVGCFPNLQRPRVVWTGVEEPTGVLQRLQVAVERELSRLGFQPEERAFTPHLTLARIRDQAQTRERGELGAWLKGQAVGRVGAMCVRRISLMRSDLRPEGAVYTRLYAAPLQHREE